MSRLRRLIVPLLVAASAARAQTVIGGQVVDRAKGTALPQVAVELLGVGDSVLATATTMADGTFMLQAPTGGSYRVRLTAPGAEAYVSDSLALANGEYAAHQFAISPAPRPFLELEVDRPVVPLRGSKAPRYPNAMRAEGISGCVIAQFVVDEEGRADTTTFRALRYTRPEFVQAVRAALPGWRFHPAQRQGKAVRQLVQQPFDFSIVGPSRVEYGSAIVPVDGVTRPPPSGRPPHTTVLPPPPPLPRSSMCGFSLR